jgi:predicted nucleic acid-binding protein
MKPNPKLFLDTNIFIYTFDTTAATKRAKACKLVADALGGRSGVISYQVVQEFLNVATRKFAKPMSVPEAELYLGRVLMPLCEVFPDADLYSQSLSISAEAGISFCDALIVSAARAAGCVLLVSEDLQHGRHFGDLRIHNPFL